MKDYWSRHIDRRRLLGGAAAMGAGAAALAVGGCGGGGPSAPRDSSGLVSTPSDTTGKAARGGIYQLSVVTEVPSFDAIAANNATASTQTIHVYPFLVRNKMAKYPAVFKFETEGDTAESWEVSGDGTQYTFKLRPNNKLDPRPPTNSRALDAQDVLWSWNYLVAKSNFRTSLAASVSPSAPIESFQSPDTRTVIVKLAFPYAPLLPMLAYSRHMPIMPREAEPGVAGGFDFRGEMRGSGAWRMTVHKRSLGYEYRRNPDWFDADKIYLDGLDVHLIPEYATGIAQFRAGNLWQYPVRAEDVLRTKREIPALLLMQNEAFTRSTTPWLGFSNRPDSPFRDDRVRKAVSLLIDRDLWIETFFNVSEFTREGIGLSTRWHSHVSSGEDGFWLDPKSKDIGDGGRFFQHDPAEAKKLLRAAGHSQPISTLFNYTLGYGSTFVRQAEVLKGMLEDKGDFQLRGVTPEHSTDWLPNYHFGNGKYEGISQGAANTYPEIDGHLQDYFHSASTRVWHGFKDAQLDSIIESQRKELNRDKRIELIKEFQRHTARVMPSLIAPGASLGFADMAWPWVGNYLLWRGSGGGQQTYMYRWFDQAKRKA